MEMEKLLNEFEDIIETAWRLPMSGGRTVVDSKDLKRILEDIRFQLPREIIEANKIIKERTQIFENAKAEVENMMRISEEKIKAMISKSEIVRRAQLTADEIVAQANVRSREIQKSANKYAENMMKQLEEILTNNVAAVKKAQQALRFPEPKL